LQGANLCYAELANTSLHGADLTHANFKGAMSTGGKPPALDPEVLSSLRVPNERIEQQAFSLEGATMANGQKYEDWFKDKGRGEHGENSGPP